MGKRTVNGSDFADVALEHSVCSHLQPILELLKEHGNIVDDSRALDKTRGGSRFVMRPIDFALIETTFEIPKFIELNRASRAVICRRCWCDIADQLDLIDR